MRSGSPPGTRASPPARPPSPRAPSAPRPSPGSSGSAPPRRASRQRCRAARARSPLLARRHDRDRRRDLAGVRHRKVDRASVHALGEGGGTTGETHARLRAPHDLDLFPGEVDPAAERFPHRLLAREAAGVALGRIGTGVAVLTLRLREAPLAEAGALEGLADALDLDDVDADLHVPRPPLSSSSSRDGNWASDETTMSGGTAALSSDSGRNLPVRTSAVRIPKRLAPGMSTSASSVTSHVSSGSASSASSAAAK